MAGIPAPGRSRGRAGGRNPLGQLHLQRYCASFCRAKKEDRDRSGVFARIDLSLSSLARVSSTLRLGGRPVVERLARHRSPVRDWPPVPCGPGVLEPCGSSSPFRFRRKTPLPHSSSVWRLWGYFVARLVGSHDEAPEASADEAPQLPIGLPLLPGNFRPFASLKPPPWF